MKTTARVRRRLAQERGFTLIELLVASTVGVVIVGVAFGLLDATVRTFGTSGQRVDVSQRGRLAVDQLSGRLRSQVCGGDETNGYTASIVLATGTKVAFWSNVGNGEGRKLRGLEYVNGVIKEYEYPGSDPSATPTRTREIATSVAPNNTGGSFFQYFAYNPAAANTATDPAPSVYLPLTAPLVAADYQKVVRITFAYKSYPENGSPTDKLAQDYNGDFVTRTAASPYEFKTPPLPTPGNLEPRCE
jgi:prepilin-type N-terminal cleavage/methylation domain-containing protein